MRRVAPLLLAAGLFSGVGMWVNAADLPSTPSPFMPSGTGNAANNAAATPDTPLELRGIIADGDRYRFSIYDPSRHSSTWTYLNEAGSEFTVKTHDVAHDTVTVDFRGQVLTLPLHTAKVTAAPISAGPGGGVAAAAQPPRPPVVLNPTSADEQKRLENIAAEVRRRRAIREQAAQRVGR